ncbi:MAG: hypothetical protein VSS75_005930 [Candidatus Parabeggiatoa sp.]|nr:hypothetical protein [Candidatus Parabeggiatoa sp.]
MDDYEIQEIRRIRQQIYSENRHDLNAVAEYYRQIEKELRNSGQYRFIDEKACVSTTPCFFLKPISRLKNFFTP